MNHQWLLAACLVWLTSQPSIAGEASGGPDLRGVIVRLQNEDGAYARYLPKSDPERILVLVHGTPGPGEGDSPIGLAEEFLTRWTAFAETHRLLVLAPAFDNPNFGGVAGPGGGYRGLFGRSVGADVFVNRLVDGHAARIKNWDGRMLLYGHSAGGQFASRYCVRHPDRILAAVISAAGRFAMPNPDVDWPYGMKRLERSMRWSPSEKRKHIVVEPEADGWLKAAMLPIAVVVGAADTGPEPARPGHEGKNRLEFARQWVRDMVLLATRNGKQAQVRLVVVPGVGHSSRGLTQTCQFQFAPVLRASKAATRTSAVPTRPVQQDGATASKP